MKKTLLLLAVALLLATTVTAKKKNKESSIDSIGWHRVDTCSVSLWTSRRLWGDIWESTRKPVKRIFEVPEGWAIDTLVDTTFVLRKIEKPNVTINLDWYQNIDIVGVKW